MNKQNVWLLSVAGVSVLVIVLLAFGTIYVVPEGHVAVVKYTGKAVRQENPGLQTKIPFFETVEVIEVRERKNSEAMPAATANQLPTTATVSINWTVNKEAALDLYVQYGGLAQFESRVLDPRMRSASKAAISKFRADEIIRERDRVTEEIQRLIVEKVSGLPITISQTQLENIELPTAYLDAVMAKEQAREQAEREKHNLSKQKLEAQQKVQTAEAERDALKAAADGRAYKIKTEAIAEANAIALINEQLARSPQYIDLVKAKAWNGVLPSTMLADESGILFQLSNRE